MGLLVPFSIKLSIAQERVFASEFDEADSRGDCTLLGLRVSFEDYEGASATLGRIMARVPQTAREYASRAAVIRELEAGILWANTAALCRADKGKGEKR